MKREAGLLTIYDPDCDAPLQEQATVQCVHCGGHWVPHPRSGTTRGFCMRCNGFICGPGCADKCVPVEQYLENLEKNRPDDFYPTQIAVPTNWAEWL